MRTQLEQTLNELHSQLAGIETLEPDERTRLQHAVEEIQKSLDQEDVSSLSLAERLSEAVTQFSDTHPTVANSVGRVADMLSQMGI
jgi:hypothetical protein